MSLSISIASSPYTLWVYFKSWDFMKYINIFMLIVMHFHAYSTVVIYKCDSCTIKKVECQRIDAFKLWCWRRLMRVPWTARRSNQSILKEINPEYLLEGLMLKLQHFGHLIGKADSLEKTLMLGKTEGRR